MEKKKIVLAGGVFDIIHPGHIHTLNAAKALGDVLVVAIATDKTAQKMKKRPPLHNQELRCELVNCLSMVDRAIIGHEDNIFETVNNIFVLPQSCCRCKRFIADRACKCGGYFRGQPLWFRNQATYRFCQEEEFMMP